LLDVWLFTYICIRQNDKTNDMTTQKYYFSEKEIQDQLGYAQKYSDLIQKELSYGNLANVENMTSYSKSFQHHSQLAKQGYVEMPA